MTDEEELMIWIDKKFYPKSDARISVYDHGLLYGDGVFEGIRAYGGIVFKLKEHIARLYRSAHAILLNIPMTREKMMEAVIETLRKNNLTDAYIRLIVTRGVGDLGLDPQKCPEATVIIIADKIKLIDEKVKEKGVTAAIVWPRRDAVDATPRNVKSLNYLNHVLGKIQANQIGVDEGICLTKEGHVCEGIAENIFIVLDGIVMTPPTSTGALKGITRQWAIETLEKLGHKVLERTIIASDLYASEEACFTGTAFEVVAILAIDRRVIGAGTPGPITKMLIREFKKAIKDPSQGTPIY